MAALPPIFKLFKIPFAVVDVVVAGLIGGVLVLVPTVGEVLSFLGMVLWLNYRVSTSLANIVIDVAVVRLLMLPVLLLLELHA